MFEEMDVESAEYLLGWIQALGFGHILAIIFVHVALGWDDIVLLLYPPPPPPEPCAVGDDNIGRAVQDAMARHGTRSAPADLELDDAAPDATVPQKAAEVDDIAEKLHKEKLFRQQSIGKMQLQGTIKGVSFERLDEHHTDCWSPVAGETFNVRIGPNYKKYGKKSPSEDAFLEVVSVDVYTVPHKVDNIFPFVDRRSPVLEGHDFFFVINIQAPGYAPPNPVWGATKEDGSGWLVVVVLAIKPEILAEVRKPQTSDDDPGHYRLLRRFLARGGPEIYDRMKVIARCMNPDDVPTLSSYVKKLIKQWNAKPVLSRPQHNVYHGADYVEIDIDVHRFAYLARVGLNEMNKLFQYMLIDVGFVLEGHSDDELPEKMLSCFRFHRVDLNKASPLPVFNQAAKAHQD